MTLVIDNGKVRVFDIRDQVSAPDDQPKPTIRDDHKGAPKGVGEPALEEAMRPTRTFLIENFQKSIAALQAGSESAAPLFTKEEVTTIRLFYEYELDRWIKHEENQSCLRKIAGTEFTHKNRTYALPRTIEIVTGEDGRRMVFLVLNRLQKNDRLVGAGASKKVKCAINLVDGSIKARYTCLASEEAEREVATTRENQGIGMHIHGAFKFFSKKSPQEKYLTSKKILAAKLLPEGETQVIMVAVYTDYAPYGSLRTAASLKRISITPLTEKLDLMQSALWKLHYLHEKRGEVHCDVKPGNMLLVEKENRSLSIKIIDLERCCKPGYTDNYTRGTLAYCPPEIIKGHFTGQFTSYCSRDIWSLGLSFLETFFGFTPVQAAFFDAGRQRNLQEMSKILGKMESERWPDDWKPSFFHWSRLPRKTGNPSLCNRNSIEYLLYGMLLFDSDTRCTAREALEKIDSIRESLTE